MTEVWYNTDDNGKTITWYDQDMDMYCTQDENGILTYMSVAEYLNTNDDSTSMYTDEDLADIAAASALNASTVTAVNSKTFKRLTRNIFALVNGKVIYLPNTASFHAEMVRKHLNMHDTVQNDDIAWKMIEEIDRGYVDYDKRFLDVYRGFGKTMPDLDNVATIVLTMLNADMISNTYLIYFCGGQFGATSVGAFLADYEIKTATAPEPF